MKKNKTKILIGCGVFCILLMLISSWYAVTFNDSRLVAPTDFGSYTFQMKDLPMIISIFLTCIYVFTLFILLIFSIVKGGKQIEQTNTTRKLNPKLGYLGLLGFLGFAGFWTYSHYGIVFPFAFFGFFGFFGFYYEGKMSGTFMDERFRENANRAQLAAYRTTFVMILIALATLCKGELFGNLEYNFIAAIIVLSFALALGVFLSEYLLYRYDQADESEE